MTNPQNSDEVNFPDLNAYIHGQGPEFVLGMDVGRLWSTGVQAFVNEAFTTIVFREQNLLPGLNGEARPALKNVASIVMPTTVFLEFYKNMAGIILQLETAQANGEG